MGYSNRELTSQVHTSSGQNIGSQHALLSPHKNFTAEFSDFESDERSLRDYLHLFIKYRWLVIGTSLLILMSAILYSFLATKLYTATATLKIGTHAPLLPSASIEDTLRQQTREQDYLNTLVNVLSSLTLANKVYAEGSLTQGLENYFERNTSFFSILTPFIDLISTKQDRENQIYDANYDYPINKLEQYHTLIKVTPVRKTSLVKVSATTNDPQFSAKLANAHSKAFIELSRSSRQNSTLDNLEFLKSQERELAGKIAASEQEMSTYAEANAIVSLNKDENIVVNRMAELNEFLTAATAKRIEAETRYKEAKKSGSGVNSTANDDNTIMQLRVDLKSAEAEYARLSKKFTPEYPKMAQLKARVDALKGNLDNQREDAVKGLEAKFQASLQSENELQKQLDMQKSEAFELARRQVKYNIMKREYDSVRDLHQAILRQLKEAQVSARSSGTNIEVSDLAAIPRAYSSPKRLRTILLALIIGPVLGIGLAFITESIDNTIRTPEEAQELLAIPSLGVVPTFSLEYQEGRLRKKPLPSKQSQSSDPSELSDDSSSELALATNYHSSDNNNRELVAHSAPWSLASEAFKSVRTSILLSSADNPPKVILVTSGQKSEGKTTIVTNLAVTLAQSSYKTILIDTDLRRPAVHKALGLDSTSDGLVEYLTGMRELERVVSPTFIENLSVIPAGTIPPNPSELLGSKKMLALLQKLATEYDYVLLDAPPVLPITDAVALSPLVDGVVLVVRGHSTSRQVAKDAMSKFTHIGSRVLGVILNDVDLRRGDYYYYRQSHYGYYAEDKVNNKRAAARG